MLVLPLSRDLSVDLHGHVSVAQHFSPSARSMHVDSIRPLHVKARSTLNRYAMRVMLRRPGLVETRGKLKHSTSH